MAEKKTTGVSAVKNYLYDTFQEHNAVNAENATTLKKLGIQLNKYHYLEPLFNSYLKAGVIHKNEDKYWLNIKQYKSYETKQTAIMVGLSGVAITLLFFLGKLLLKIVA